MFTFKSWCPLADARGSEISLSGRYLIELDFEFANCGEVIGFAAEEFDDFDGCAEGWERVHFEDGERLEGAPPIRQMT